MNSKGSNASAEVTLTVKQPKMSKSQEKSQKTKTAKTKY